MGAAGHHACSLRRWWNRSYTRPTARTWRACPTTGCRCGPGTACRRSAAFWSISVAAQASCPSAIAVPALPTGRPPGPHEPRSSHRDPLSVRSTSAFMPSSVIRPGTQAVRHSPTALVCRITSPPSTSATAPPPSPLPPTPSTTASRSTAIPRRTPRTRPIPERGNPRRSQPTGVPHPSPAITGTSPTASTHLDHKDLTWENAPDLDHLDATRRFRQPVPGGTERRAQYEYGGVVGAVDPVLQGLLTHPATLPIP